MSADYNVFHVSVLAIYDTYKRIKSEGQVFLLLCALGGGPSLDFSLLLVRLARAVQPAFRAVQPLISTIHCLLLNLSVMACYPSACLPSSSPDPSSQARSRLALSAIAVIQLICFQQLPDSCCTMDAHNTFPSNRLRTLSIAMGVYTPPAVFIDSLFSNLLYFPPSIPFLFNGLQNAPPATPLL
jgi:hypothetical protein